MHASQVRNDSPSNSVLGRGGLGLPARWASASRILRKPYALRRIGAGSTAPRYCVEQPGHRQRGLSRACCACDESRHGASPCNPSIPALMRILFITTAHNSLSQRLHIELTQLGHAVSVALATSEQAMLEAVQTSRPDLIIAPMLKKSIPEAIWRRHTCIIVHPGIKGDRGPSSLDWAITLGEKTWGVTTLQAKAEIDAGAIWASHNFRLHERPYAKSSVYRHEVTESAVRGVLDAVKRFESGDFTPEALDYGKPDVRGELRQIGR